MRSITNTSTYMIYIRTTDLALELQTASLKKEIKETEIH